VGVFHDSFYGDSGADVIDVKASYVVDCGSGRDRVIDRGENSTFSRCEVFETPV
jgi:hypothetical protein